MIRNCPRTSASSPRSVELLDGVETRGLGVALECPRTWERLEPTEQPGVRRCGACQEHVYESWSEEEARAHIEQGRCVVQMFISLSARGRPAATPNGLQPHSQSAGEASVGELRSVHGDPQAVEAEGRGAEPK